MIDKNWEQVVKSQTSEIDCLRAENAALKKALEEENGKRDELSKSLNRVLTEKYNAFLPALKWYAVNLKERWNGAMDLDALAKEARLALISVGEWPVATDAPRPPETKEPS